MFILFLINTLIIYIISKYLFRNIIYIIPKYFCSVGCLFIFFMVSFAAKKKKLQQIIFAVQNYFN